MTASWTLAARLARRELRAGLRGFRLFVACLLLGVAALAAVGSVADELLEALARDGRTLLGGDVELRLAQRRASDEELAWLTANSSALSATAELRAMAKAAPGYGPPEGARRLVELKAVDSAYPLHGALTSDPPLPLSAALSCDAGLCGALVDAELLTRLGLQLGDHLTINEASYEVRGTILREPDRTARAFTLGPRVLVALDSLPGTGLVQPGSLIYDHYRLDLPPGQTFADWSAALTAALPDAGWRLRGLDDASPGLARFVSQTRLFMTLVGLTTLLIGGVGVANAVRAFLAGRRDSIATLKCLGAPARLIFRIYLLQVMTLALVGVGLGLILGALVPLLATPFLEARVNLSLSGALHPGALLQATVMGLLTALLFTLLPLAQAERLPGAALFRGAQALPVGRPSWRLLLLAGGVALLLGLVAVLGSDDPLFALFFVAAAVATLLLFRLAAWGAQALARALPHARRPSLRLALANLHRPGSATPSVVVSFGLGLTVLAAVALIRASLAEQLQDEIPATAPAFYFLDIQKADLPSFLTLVEKQPGVGAVEQVPMLRGRITAVRGVAVEAMVLPPEVAWIFQGDRGLTWAASMPEGTTLTLGDWWPADYSGPPLVSLDDEVGRALGLVPGDKLTINVLGRDLEVTIANLRTVRWQELRIAFVMVFSPGLLESAPSTHIATVEVDPAQEAALERSVTDSFPSVSAIRVREALASFSALLDNVVTAIAGIGAIGVIAGLLVLAGAMAADARQRRYEAVMLKVLGANRAVIARTFLLEYGALGLVTATIATGLGSLAAWAVVAGVMEMPFLWSATPLLATAAAGVGVTLFFGFLGTWRALGQSAAPFLRNE